MLLQEDRPKASPDKQNADFSCGNSTLQSYVWFIFSHHDCRGLFKMYFCCSVDPGRKPGPPPACRRQEPRDCKMATDLWLNSHFVMREGHNASTQVSVEACCGVYHHDCFKNWNGLFIGCQSHQEHTHKHTELCFPAWLRHRYYYYYYFFDRSPKPQIFSCSPLVILPRRRSDVYYFPAAGRIIYEGKPARLPAAFKQDAGQSRY